MHSKKPASFVVRTVQQIEIVNIFVRDFIDRVVVIKIILFVKVLHIIIRQDHLGQVIQEWIKENLWKTNFNKIWSDLVCPSRRYHFSFFKGCLPQILLGPFLNTLPHLNSLWYLLWYFIYKFEYEWMFSSI